ncbi:MAG: hypothetical protein IPP06_17220 [Saprospiraceae bacterium]|nr:hypothetical protein [Candidatus Vicinibacter affinis]
MKTTSFTRTKNIVTQKLMNKENVGNLYFREEYGNLKELAELLIFEKRLLLSFYGCLVILEF